MKEQRKRKKNSDCLRRIAAFLCAFSCLFCMAACDGKGSETAEPDEPAPVKQTTLQADHIIMTYQTMENSRLDDLSEVVDAINAIAIPEIGVEVELKLVDAVDAFTEYPLWIGNGETVDLMMLNYQDVTAYVKQGMLQPISQLLAEEAPDICQIMEKEHHLEEGSIVDGEIYGITTYGYLGSGGGIWFAKETLDRAGITYDRQHVYTYEELSDIFSALKKKNPDAYPLGQITSNGTGSTFSYYFHGADSLGSTWESGVIMDEESNKVENFYATEEYYQFLYYLREWYKKGYIYPEAAITDYSTMELCKSGVILGWPLSSSPGIVSGILGEDAVCLRTSEVYIESQSSRSGFWVIPVTSEYPEAAMRFLNLMYRDARIANLLTYGIEGKHYVVTDKENGTIDFPEGETMETVGFYNSLGLYGDRHQTYWWGTAENRRQRIEYEQEAKPNPARNSGFTYSSDQVETELSAVSAVLDKYIPVLESGSVDLDKYYMQFLSELSAAGIDRVIADKQAQYDAWRAAQGG